MYSGESTSDAETRKAVRWRQIGRVDIVDTRAGRTAPNRHLEALNRISVPFGHDFDASIVIVSHLASDVLTPRGVFNKQTKPHALHAPLHDETTRDEHAELYIHL